MPLPVPPDDPNGKPLPVFRSSYPGERLLALQRDPIAFLRRLAREKGDAVRFRLGTNRVVLLSHPEQVREVLVEARENFIRDGRVRHTEYLIGNGLINSEGDFHLRQRRMIQPAFQARRMALYSGAMARQTATLDAEWRALSPEARRSVDIGGAMTRLTLAIASETLFGHELHDEAGAVSEALTVALERFGMVMIPFSRLLLKLPLPGALELNEAREQLDMVLYAMIAARRSESATLLEKRVDLLSLLLAARDAEGDGEGMSDQQVHDEAMTLFLAGHETTANALTWALYLLARHPQAAIPMREELNTTFPDDRLPTIEDIGRLPATRRFVSETLRLYPPIWISARGAFHDYRLKHGGYRIPSGALVIFSQCVLHTDPRWWPGSDPFAFDPERFLPEREADRPRYAFLPFGTGPHACIGEPFAWTEMLLAMAFLVRRWEFAQIADEIVDPAPLLTLRPKTAVRLKISLR